MKKGMWILSLIGLLALAVAAQAARPVDVIHAGLDSWKTPADGRTFTDFKRDPIPAGFFCSGSAPFTGRIVYKGARLAGAAEAGLRNADTLVHRLDDAPFNKRGVASTRIQVRALSLVSVEAIQTSCGAFDAKLVLAGDQPVTTMRIVRETPTGGFYIANLALNARLIFTPVGKPKAAPRILQQSVRFNQNPPAAWTSERPAGVAEVEEAFVKVDTDGDGRPETLLPGRSNFFAGVASIQEKIGFPQPCHWYDDPLDGLTKRHCPVPDY